MTTLNKIFMPIAFLMTLPFIYTVGYINEIHTPNKPLHANYGKVVMLWDISKHDNWTDEDRSAAMVYLFGEG